MGDDINLQKALLASFQSARPSQSGYGGGNRGSFSRSSGPSITRNFSKPISYRKENYAYNDDRFGYGHIDALRRCNIAPAYSFNRASNRISTKTESCSSSNSQGVEKETNWMKIFGSGLFTLNQKQNPVLDSPHGLSLFLYKKEEVCFYDSSYRLLVNFICGHITPGSGKSSAFQIVLGGVKNEDRDFKNGALVVDVDCKDREWQIKHRQNNQWKIINKQSQRDLRPGVLHEAKMQITKEGLVSITCDNQTVFDNTQLPKIMSKNLGVALEKSKLFIKQWQLSAENNSDSNLIEEEGGKAAIQLNFVGEEQHLVDAIERDLIIQDLGVTFDDIASLQNAKRLLHETVTLPLIVPEVFTGIREPYKGILLFGPPGTGKTLLAKAVASTNNVKFFCASGATLMSKWRGESEKLLRCLFNMARQNAPAIIFFDEVDALITSRGTEGEHEASRRFKSELLQHMDGLLSGQQNGNVMVLASTNCPWDIDEAMRRRLEKRIYVPLPDSAARKAMFQIHLKNTQCQADVDMEDLARRTKGYSGADIKTICRDGCMMPLRRLIAKKSPNEIKQMKENGELDVGPSMLDFKQAITNVNPSVSADDIQKFEAWNQEFASV